MQIAKRFLASVEASGENVLVVGEALMDVVSVDGLPSEEHVGGSPLNVAIGLSRLAVPTTFASQLGGDSRAQIIRGHLGGSGVGLISLNPSPTATPTATAVLSSAGGATYNFDVTWNPSELPGLAGFDALHVGSLGAALEPGAKAVVDLAARANELGIRVSFDPNVRLTVEPDAAVWRHAFEMILPHVSYLKLSDEDALVLFPGATLPDLVHELAADDRIVAITGGEGGSHIAMPSLQCSIYPAVARVVDTIGAGDSYMAAMLAWFARRGWPPMAGLDVGDLEQLGTFAATAAGITCSRPGADPPWSREIALR